MRRVFLSCCLAVAALIFGLWTNPAIGSETVKLSAPQRLVETGLLKYVLPRFSLKTGVRLSIVGEGEAADLVLSPDVEGPRVFSGPEATWRLGLANGDHAGAVRFSEWLRSEVGQRTVASFEIDGVAPFSPPSEDEVEVAAVTFDGDAVKGEDLSITHCGRCHAVNEATRINTIGSTPSFFALRAMRDWDVRFQSFYVLNPHPAFTQIEEVTPPFPVDRPSPIVPMEMTLDDLEAILAYVAVIPPANLGAPVEHQ